MELLNTKDINMSNIRIAVGVYGVSGTGKTTFGSTFPSPCFLDTDEGLLSIRGKDVLYYNLPKQDSWYLTIKDAMDLAGKNPDVKSIIVDSMTGVATAAMEYTQTVNNNVNKKPNFDDWIVFANTITDFVVKLKSYGKHVLLICHENTDKDENTGRVWCLPAVQGQMKGKLSNLFDEFYHSEVEAVPGKPSQYKLLARPSSIYTAKSRLLKDPKVTHLSPNFNELLLLAR